MMKHATITVLVGLLLILGVATSCRANPPAALETSDQGATRQTKDDMTVNRIKLRIGAKTFTITLADNPTASAFKALLPLKLEMEDLHGNEKYFHLPSRLPTDDSSPGTVQAGDLMLWSSNSVVLFYKTFPTSYRYTRLGRIDDPKGLAAAVGPGDVTIQFELE